ncbi:MAG: CAP domain-containing protein, partial [Patescibacteria group bacterium]|nr:CAP domain-containing protein [Patescibacteria group bacterium]
YLKEGYFGDEVFMLQYILSKELKDYPKNLYTGYFGIITKNYLIKFQNKYGLKQTGYLDDNTIKKINELYGYNNKDYLLSQIREIINKNQKNTNQNSLINNNTEWGVAKQISEKTWTMKVGFDQKMATPQEIFNALNVYRERHGRNSLQWDERLANFALERAKYFTQIGRLDEHKGFEEYVNNIDNLKKLGFWRVGENSSYGYRLEGVHLIEWVFAGDEPHNNNQLDPEWTHVGIGVDGYQVDIIFGGNPF